MNFSDIVALAKAGYTPKDVKDLLELTETDPKTKNAEVPVIDEKQDQKTELPKDSELNAFEKLIKENT